MSSVSVVPRLETLGRRSRETASGVPATLGNQETGTARLRVFNRVAFGEKEGTLSMNVGWRRKHGLLAALLALTAGGWLTAGEYYVDQLHPLASDANAGTADLPWQTFGKAVSAAQADDTVWIKAGTYRESVSTFAHSGEYYGSVLYFITLAAYSNDAVIIGGTRTIGQAEWQATVGTSNVYDVGLTDDPNQVFVDGARCPESLAALTDGTTGQWYWDGAASRLYMNTGGGNPSVGHTVEPSVYSFAVDLEPRPGTPFGGRGVWNTAIRLRGLVFDRLRTGLEGSVRFGVIED